MIKVEDLEKPEKHQEEKKCHRLASCLKVITICNTFQKRNSRVQFKLTMGPFSDLTQWIL